MKEEKKALVVVESPTKADTIRKYLPQGYTVMASKGHVRDLPEDRMAIDTEHGFQPEYVVSEGKQALISEMKKKLKGADELLLATDEDREGESISWHLMELLKPEVPHRRMVFHEITRSAIQEALKGGRPLDMNLVKAQEDRRIIDRLYGYEVSPVLWKKLSNSKLSGGRVQSVGLRFIVEREMARLNHKASTYYDIKAELQAEGGEKFCTVLERVGGSKVATGKDFDSMTGEFSGKSLLLSKEDVDKLVESLGVGGGWTVAQVEDKPSTSSPQPPFTTSTLQQAASSRLHLSSRETMSVAQSLFENGFITYMRTDSVNLSDECVHAARVQVEREFGSDYLNPGERRFKNKSKNAQEAHEAIRPAGDTFRAPHETGLKGKELALYTLIWIRTLATQMAPAKKSTTTIKITKDDCVFSASGTVILFPGYLKAYADDKDENEMMAQLPRLEKGDEVSALSLAAQEHTTTPPARYSEASLIKKLEEQGIGRPSTYATIISTLLDRGYVREKDRTMIPTFTGFAVNSCVTRAFPRLVDYGYTSRMEDELDRIASGEEDSQDYLRRFYYGDGDTPGLKAMVEEAKAGREDYKTLVFPHLSGSCALSDGSSVSYQIKVGPYGAYLFTDRKKDDGKALLVNIPPYTLPGCISDKDIAELVETGVNGARGAADGSVTLRRGQRGEYWQKGDKTCNVPKGRKKAEDYTPEEIEYLFSLPREIGKDAEGEPIVLASGPYGFYIKYKGSNHKVFGTPFNMTEEEALANIGKRRAGSGEAKSFEPVDGKAVSLRRGKFGPYLKWGASNVRIPSGTKADELTQEDVERLCRSQSPEKSGAPGLGEWNGRKIVLMDGRYGRYLKVGTVNYNVPRSAPAEITPELALLYIEEGEKSRKGPEAIGEYEGKPVFVAHGKYGYYIKWDGGNYALDSKWKKSVDGLPLEDAVAAIRRKNG